MDCIGPIDPSSSQGHKNCLCIIDSCTISPTMYMLKSMTAKAVCDALLDLFVNVDVPKVIISDCGTNFTSELTREMLSRLGYAPRFNTSGHPESSGLIEWFNQTCKEMLHHVIQRHQRQWHQYVPLMLWTLREIPNATTGVSPFNLVYGRNPRGPLTILKESWTQDKQNQASLIKSVEDYLLDLKTKLEEVNELVQDHAAVAQREYTRQYSRRAKDKHFEVGDQVLVLAPTNTGKMGNRWQGPGTVVCVKSPNSYLAELDRGQIRHIHANKMRGFVVRVQCCSVSDLRNEQVLSF